MIELKNIVQCSFADTDSAFSFFLSFKDQNDQKKKTISKSDFEKATISLSANRFNKGDID